VLLVNFQASYFTIGLEAGGLARICVYFTNVVLDFCSVTIVLWRQTWLVMDQSDENRQMAKPSAVCHYFKHNNKT
jgi:hypothetical protein